MASVTKIERTRREVVRVLATRGAQTWEMLAHLLEPPGLALQGALERLLAAEYVTCVDRYYMLTARGLAQAARQGNIGYGDPL